MFTDSLFLAKPRLVLTIEFFIVSLSILQTFRLLVTSALVDNVRLTEDAHVQRLVNYLVGRRSTLTYGHGGLRIRLAMGMIRLVHGDAWLE